MRGARAALAGACLLAVLALSPGAAAKGGVLATDDDGFRSRYEPAEPRVAPGEEVLVTNTGRDRHTLTAVEGAPWPEVDVEPGQAGSFRAPSEPGTYRFYCRYHASAAATMGMVGTLHVAPAAGEGARGAPVPGAWALLGLAAAALIAARARG